MVKKKLIANFPPELTIKAIRKHFPQICKALPAPSAKRSKTAAVTGSAVGPDLTGELAGDDTLFKDVSSEMMVIGEKLTVMEHELEHESSSSTSTRPADPNPNPNSTCPAELAGERDRLQERAGVLKSMDMDEASAEKAPAKSKAAAGRRRGKKAAADSDEDEQLDSRDQSRDDGSPQGKKGAGRRAGTAGGAGRKSARPLPKKSYVPSDTVSSSDDEDSDATLEDADTDDDESD